MEGYPKPVTKETHKKISYYLDNSIYQIKGVDGKCGIAFFCNIRCHDKIIPVLITSYQLINEEYFINYNKTDILINEERVPIELGYINYMDKDLDLTVIEIKENNNIKFLDLDDNIYKKESEMNFKKESIYIIHYNNKDICVSYGIVNNINNS